MQSSISGRRTNEGREREGDLYCIHGNHPRTCKCLFEKVLYGFDIMVGRCFNRFHSGCGVDVELCDDGVEGSKSVGGQGGDFRDRLQGSRRKGLVVERKGAGKKIDP